MATNSFSIKIYKMVETVFWCGFGVGSASIISRKNALSNFQIVCIICSSAFVNCLYIIFIFLNSYFLFYCYFLCQMYNYKISFKTNFIVFVFFNRKSANDMALKRTVLVWKVTFVVIDI